MTQAPAANTFSGDQLNELLALIKGSDSVELKTSVPEVAHRSAITALGLDPMDAQVRQVFFFDTPDLALDKQGVVARARRIQGKGGDSIVKLRPCVPSELAPEVRKSAGLPRRGRRHAGRLRLLRDDEGGARAGRRQGGRPQGEKSIRSLFSKEQRAFFAAHVAEGLALDDLTVLGPIFVLKVRFDPEELDRRMVAEMWLYPDGSRILELSTRCETSEAFQVAAEVRAFLATRDVDISGEQETKTRKALDYFAEVLKVTIVPRWEWRTFGPGLDDAESRVRELDAERVEDSDEVYLLSTESDASVKVRGGQMDVKTLQAVNDDGLEQWLPVLKASFPIASDDVATVFEALGAPLPADVRPTYTLEELVSELIDPSAGLRAVDVHKHREHYTVGGCMAELSEIQTEAGARATIAVESPDAEAVIAAVRDLGLASRENTCLPRGLKALGVPA